MKQEMLDSLVGLSVLEARKQVRDAGLKEEAFPHDDIITLQARPGTVLIWHRGGEVINATAGDPLELE